MLETQSLIAKILDFLRRRSWLVIIVAVVITAGFKVARLKVRVEPDLESLLAKGTRR